MSTPRSLRRDPICWFDASSLLRLRNHTPVGLTRVESHVLRAALELPVLTTAFGRFNRHVRCFEAVPRERIEKLLAGFGAPRVTKPGRPKRSGLLKRWGRQLESRARKAVRGPLQSAMIAMTGRSNQADLQPGDSLIISGSTWDNFDPRWLAQMASMGAVNLNCILADMIPWKFPHHFHDVAAVRRFLDFAEVLARFGRLVACISRSTQADFQEFSRSLAITRDATEVILLGADILDAASPLDGLPDDLVTRGFILSVSTIQVRKNQQLLYNLWRRFAEEQRHSFPRLVLVGANGWLTEELRTQINNDPLTKDSILVLNHVGDSHLQWLYQNCRFTLYPSLYEGWGLPIVESLQHGKACIASNTSSMPEASQNLAVHLDPHDFASWHEWIVRWALNHASLSAFEETIARQFRMRSWNSFADEFFGKLLEPQREIKTEASAA